MYWTLDTGYWILETGHGILTHFPRLGVRLEHDDVRELPPHRVAEVAERPDPHQLVVHHLQVVLVALVRPVGQGGVQPGSTAAEHTSIARRHDRRDAQRKQNGRRFMD